MSRRSKLHRAFIARAPTPRIFFRAKDDVVSENGSKISFVRRAGAIFHFDLETLVELIPRGRNRLAEVLIPGQRPAAILLHPRKVTRDRNEENGFASRFHRVHITLPQRALLLVRSDEPTER